MTMARVSYEVTCVGALGPIRRRIGISRRRDTANNVASSVPRVVNRLSAQRIRVE